MKILVFGINYTPELTGIGKYTGDMCSWLESQGHDVSVITALPYYPEWQVHSKYKSKFWHHEMIEGVMVYRCPLYVPKSVTSIKRIIHELSFCLSSLPVWLRLIIGDRFDVVLGVHPPFHLGLVPLIMSKLSKFKIVNHIQDLQVDAAQNLNMIKNPFFLNIMFRTEKYILDSSDAVSTISPGMQRKIEYKGISSKKIWQFPNWVDDRLIKPLDKNESLRHELGFSDFEKIILYSGNLGEKQGLEIIIDAAKHFNDNEHIKFVISGTGGGKERLQALASNAGVSNITFIPLQPIEKLSALLNSADLHLVLQKKSASDLVMPSKLTGILSAGGCALVSADPGTSLHDVVKDNDLGILMEPESSDALIEAISIALSSDLTAYQERARAYAVKHLSKDAILGRFEKQLQDLIDS